MKALSVPEGVTLRRFETLEDYHECVRFQEATWGEGFSERVPVAILKVSQILGGVAAGAYDDDGKMLGFVYGMTGLLKREVVHWSDMLAVRPGLRGTGLGMLLKAYQRQLVLEAGVTTMYWTFDPLESRNAYLNLNKLGAVADEYVRDMYGQTDSPLHAGIGTDRFVPRWELDSPWVVARFDGGAVDRGPEQRVGAEGRALGAELVGAFARPLEPVTDLETPVVRVAVPESIQAIKADSLTAAVEWREATREVFEAYIGRGYVARALVRHQGYSDYLLIRSDDDQPSSGDTA